MAKKYYWLKLKRDFFSSREMKKLRRIAGGDTYTIIYLKLQLLSLEDEGYIYYEGVEGDIYEEMALVLDEDEENVKVTMQYLEAKGLLKRMDDHEFLLTEVPFLIGSETDKAELMRRKRAQERLKLGNNVTAMLPDVTKCYTEKEIEKEKEIEIEIEIDKEKRERIDYQQIVDMYNDTCVSFPRLTTLSEARKKAIKARLNVYSLEDFKKLFELAESSTFLKGGNNRNWSATFDWLIKDSNMAKVLDGNYNDKGKSQATNQTAQELNDFYDMASNWAESEVK